MVCLACQPLSQKYSSLGDTSLIQGICPSSTQLYLDQVRETHAGMNIKEQSKVWFTKGMMVETEETGVRAERVKCRSPCQECGPNCEGYRLMWNRWNADPSGRSSTHGHCSPAFQNLSCGWWRCPPSSEECDTFLPTVARAERFGFHRWGSCIRSASSKRCQMQR